VRNEGWKLEPVGRLFSKYSSGMQRAGNQGLTRHAGVLGYVVLSIIVLVLYSSWNRPIWYDEMVYFVLGGLGSTADALAVIQETTTNVNQGVTGAYMLVDYWSLSIFGAELWALRLPSLIFGIYFLAASAVFLRGRQVPWVGLWALPVLLIGQQTLMYYVGEARTYMPLVAAVSGVLAYYFIPLADRSRWSVRLLGWSAVFIGVLFHPYFALYWPVILFFAATVQHRWKGIVAFANAPMVVVGGLLFVVVGSLTWLRGNASTENLDPYFWLGDEIWRAIPAQLFQWVYVQRILVVALGLLVIVMGALTCRTRADLVATIRRVWPPLLLLVLAGLLALAIALISLQQGFWIIPRQWVASIALASIGVVWFLSVMVQRVREVIGKRSGLITAALAGAIILAGAVAPATGQWNQLRGWHADRQAIVLAEVPDQIDAQAWIQQLESGEADPWSEDEWIALSNANVWRGGPVWPEFGSYYATRDWSEFVIRD
jgi:hypothetical protein